LPYQEPPKEKGSDNKSLSGPMNGHGSKPLNLLSLPFVFNIVFIVFVNGQS
jgi:hypothetical protein